MDEKRIHLTYYYWAMFCLWMATFGMLAGKVLWFDETTGWGDVDWFVAFIHRETESVFFYLILTVYAFFAIALLHKSMLFVGTNREDLIAGDGFDLRFVGLEKPADGMSGARIITVLFFSLLIANGVGFIHFKSESIKTWLIGPPEEQKRQRPEKKDGANPPGRCVSPQINR